jgi:hypothetical protein
MYILEVETGCIVGQNIEYMRREFSLLVPRIPSLLGRRYRS